MKKIILCSGGLDSSTILSLEHDENTIVLFFNYGQKAYEQEKKAVNFFVHKFNTTLIEYNIENLFSYSKCTLLKKEPFLEYNKFELEFRNGIFLSCAISLAMQLFPDENVNIIIGCIQIQIPYGDCSIDFIESYDKIAKLCSNNKITITAPFINIGKDKVLKIAQQQNLEIDKTWSCYGNDTHPCKRCSACIDRQLLKI